MDEDYAIENEAITRAANKPCPECGGQRIIAESELKNGFLIATGWFTTTKTIPVSCVNCGYTTLYTQDPHKVRKYYLKQ